VDSVFLIFFEDAKIVTEMRFCNTTVSLWSWKSKSFQEVGNGSSNLSFSNERVDQTRLFIVRLKLAISAMSVMS